MNVTNDNFLEENIYFFKFKVTKGLMFTDQGDPAQNQMANAANIGGIFFYAKIFLRQIFFTPKNYFTPKYFFYAKIIFIRQ